MVRILVMGSAALAILSGCGSDGTITRGAGAPPLMVPTTLPLSISALASSTAAAGSEALADDPADTQYMTKIGPSGSVTLTPFAVSVNNAVAGDGKIEVGALNTNFVASRVTDASGKIKYVGSAAGKTVTLFPIDAYADVVLNSISGTDSVTNERAYSFNAMGAKTLAGSLPTGIATYNGQSYVIAMRDDGAVDSASGNVQLIADFGAGRYMGSMDLKSPTDTSRAYDIKDFTIDITGGNIGSGGQLNPSVLAVSPGQFVVDPTPGNNSTRLSGQIYGASGNQAAGQFHISGETNTGTGDKVILQGGFIGSR